MLIRIARAGIVNFAVIAGVVVFPLGKDSWWAVPALLSAVCSGYLYVYRYKRYAKRLASTYRALGLKAERDANRAIPRTGREQETKENQ